jgi:hypothetical protein
LAATVILSFQQQGEVAAVMAPAGVTAPDQARVLDSQLYSS